jgi:hypothetical protein
MNEYFILFLVERSSMRIKNIIRDININTFKFSGENAAI